MVLAYTLLPSTVSLSLSLQSQVKQARRVLKQERVWQKAESERASTEWLKARREEELKEATVSVTVSVSVRKCEAPL